MLFLGLAEVEVKLQHKNITFPYITKEFNIRELVAELQLITDDLWYSITS